MARRAALISQRHPYGQSSRIRTLAICSSGSTDAERRRGLFCDRFEASVRPFDVGRSHVVATYAAMRLCVSEMSDKILICVIFCSCSWAYYSVNRLLIS